jgi:hypothetical protein
MRDRTSSVRTRGDSGYGSSRIVRFSRFDEFELLVVGQVHQRYIGLQCGADERRGTSFRERILTQARKISLPEVTDPSVEPITEFVPDSPLEQAGFELVWEFFCQVVFCLLPVLLSRRFFVRSGKAVLRPVACDSRSARKGSRDRNASRA